MSEGTTHSVAAHKVIEGCGIADRLESAARGVRITRYSKAAKHIAAHIERLEAVNLPVTDDERYTILNDVLAWRWFNLGRQDEHLRNAQAERHDPWSKADNHNWQFCDHPVCAMVRQYEQQLEAERHTCPGCNHLATLLVNADACPRQFLHEGWGWCGEHGKSHTCADEDTADCVARIVAWEEGR
jgi:hypothetical protein